MEPVVPIPQALPDAMQSTPEEFAHEARMAMAARRDARMSGLTLTGSIGVLIKAKRLGFPVVIRDAMIRMWEHGIWLSETCLQLLCLPQTSSRYSTCVDVRRPGLIKLNSSQAPVFSGGMHPGSPVRPFSPPR